jgi:hypothetical protein
MFGLFEHSHVLVLGAWYRPMKFELGKRSVRLIILGSRTVLSHYNVNIK